MLSSALLTILDHDQPTNALPDFDRLPQDTQVMFREYAPNIRTLSKTSSLNLFTSFIAMWAKSYFTRENYFGWGEESPIADASNLASGFYGAY